ncbi:UxaA family hydrolase [Streptosporangiaceae bacterium NEAU-GS5]|nr:UxaA family hydrolase [Streptosporangiaceae bacterium NEAU-GS5]
MNVSETMPYALLVLADEDDVAIAVRDLEPGPHRTSNGRTLEITEPVALGHKIALRSLAQGEHVVRFGMVIGSATVPVEPGSWVHTHNLASNYIVTFAHRGGEQ